MQNATRVLAVVEYRARMNDAREGASREQETLTLVLVVILSDRDQESAIQYLEYPLYLM